MTESLRGDSLMNVTKMVHNGELSLLLMMDDGTYAIHHGMSVWTICDNTGRYVRQYDAYSETASCEVSRAIQTYSLNHAGKSGRIAA